MKECRSDEETDLRGTRSLSRSKLISRPYHGQMTNIWEENAMKEMRMTVPPTLLMSVGQQSAGTKMGRKGEDEPYA